MKIKFNSGYKIVPEKEPFFIWKQKEKEASENLSNICARMKAKELKLEMLR